MNAALRSTHAIHLKGEFDGRRSAVSIARKPSAKPTARANRSSTGVWGSVLPDPGSAHTSKTRNPQILIACLDALNRWVPQRARIAADYPIARRSQMGSIGAIPHAHPLKIKLLI